MKGWQPKDTPKNLNPPKRSPAYKPIKEVIITIKTKEANEDV